MVYGVWYIYVIVNNILPHYEVKNVVYLFVYTISSYIGILIKCNYISMATKNNI